MYYIIDTETTQDIPGSKVIAIAADIQEIKNWYLYKWRYEHKEPDMLPYSILNGKGECMDNEIEEMIERCIGESE